MSGAEVRARSGSGASGVSECVLSCHCCYDVLVNPTTLTCGHSFCRHCLAQWWESSRRTECPECREPWLGFPRVNILLRDAVEKLHEADVRRRREEIQSNVRISRSLLAFQRFGDEQANHRSAAGRAGSFCSGVFLTLSCVTVMLLMYRWSSGGIRHDDLVNKPISRWTVDDVTLWLEQLGAWTNQYRETFSREQVNGRARSGSGASGVSECVLSCHCCYDVLVNPTTLTCGHSFCRHCLAQWWESSRRTECPECREPWLGFPRVNILLRDAVEKLHEADVRRRREEIQSNVRISRSLLAFQRFGDEQANHRSAAGRAGSFCSGVFLTLSCVTVMLLMYRWSSGGIRHDDLVNKPISRWTVDDVTLWLEQLGAWTNQYRETFSREQVMLLMYRWSSGGIRHDDLVNKPISRWTVDDVTLWLEQLGAWTNQYRETFSREQVNGRLLNLLGDDELLGAPFLMENPAHRRAILQELHRVQTLGVKPPRDLWEYKVANEGKSLFLVYALKDSPRLSLLLLYLFDYDASFLPLIHTCCPTHSEPTEWVGPSQWQWAWLVVKWLLLPYQLLAEFACDWLSVHYWTSRIVIVNAVLLSLREGHAVWSGWRRAELRMLPHRVFAHVWKLGIHSVLFLFLWPLLPQCVWNGLFYWGLYCSPAFNTHTLLQQLLRRTHTHQA
ncbi:hypothetical protein PDJAM_G00163140 [Pangasius djambal]|uniref:Uncharacterized protein n=1 Tax=Pangasius djambal TaxID=1691987 RepID=A0ACC5ZKT2_9TELE|nr:hypothetical protein [Pangasius djambal]